MPANVKRYSVRRCTLAIDSNKSASFSLLMDSICEFNSKCKHLQTVREDDMTFCCLNPVVKVSQRFCTNNITIRIHNTPDTVLQFYESIFSIFLIQNLEQNFDSFEEICDQSSVKETFFCNVQKVLASLQPNNGKWVENAHIQVHLHFALPFRVNMAVHNRVRTSSKESGHMLFFNGSRSYTADFGQPYVGPL